MMRSSHILLLLLCTVLTSMPLVASGPASFWEPVELQVAPDPVDLDIQPTADGQVSIHLPNSTQPSLPQSKRPRFVLSQVQFTDLRHGWAIGSNGLIFHTDDGGVTWQQQNSQVQTWLSDLMFLDRMTGWAVGEAGAILHTIDGGLNWYAQRAPSSEYFTSVYFIDSWHGWIVGRHSMVLHTQDGGRSWESKTVSIRIDDYSDVHFLDSQRGWIVGHTSGPLSAVVLTTSDGGVTWHDQTSDFASIPPIWSIDFYDRHRGMMVGDQGTVLLTQDGGLSWYQTTVPTLHALHRVTYDSNGMAWVVGQAGMILRRIDTGWLNDAIPLRRSLTGIAVIDGQAWVTSDSGILWHSIADKPSQEPLLVVPVAGQEDVPDSVDVAETISEAGGVDLLSAAMQYGPEVAQVRRDPPEPHFLWVVVPDQAKIGTPLTVDIGVINNGGVATSGEISISLPENPRFLIVDYDTTQAHSFARGELIWSLTDDKRMPASYPLIEAVQEEWLPMEAHGLKLRILPTQQGVLNLYIRAALRDTRGGRFLLPTDGPRDQQGFAAKHYQITVR